jgi:membrane-bound lytic murein transglycosylase B
MSTSVDSHRGAGPSEPPESSGTPETHGEATDRFRVPVVGEATERFRAPRVDEPAEPEADPTPEDPPAANPWFAPAVPTTVGGATPDDGGPEDEAVTGAVPAAPDDGAVTGSVAAAPEGEAVTGAVPAAPDDGAVTGSVEAATGVPDEAAPEDGALDDEAATGTVGVSSDGLVRPRRRSRGMRVPSAPRAAPPSRAEDLLDTGIPSAPIAAALTATSPRVGLATGSSAGSPPVLPVGGPPPPSSSPTPPRRTAAVGRLVLVLVLLAAVVGTVVVLQQGTQFGRNDAGPEEIPALEVAPAQVDLGSVTQPTATAPPASLLPGSGTNTPTGGNAASISDWANGLGPKTNIPPIALQAYGIADVTMRKVDPACHLSWVTIAGLARIESNHGRYRGAHIAPNGDIEPRIVGVPLDGTSGNRTISDTDGGVLDGDPTLDRAVGPLQFIPSTWAKWRADGNNDGRADPDNIFDAALAAGRYLCAGGRDLASGQGWRSAVLSYNNSDDYGRRVYAAAEAYANSKTP